MAHNKLRALEKLQALSSRYIPNYESSGAAEEMVIVGKKLRVLVNPGSEE